MLQEAFSKDGSPLGVISYPQAPCDQGMSEFVCRCWASRTVFSEGSCVCLPPCSHSSFTLILLMHLEYTLPLDCTPQPSASGKQTWEEPDMVCWREHAGEAAASVHPGSRAPRIEATITSLFILHLNPYHAQTLKVSVLMLLKARKDALAPQVRRWTLKTQSNRDFLWLQAHHFYFNLQMGMLSLKTRMESSHSLKWSEHMTPQSRGLMSGHESRGCEASSDASFRGVPGLHQNLLTNSSLVQGGEMDLSSSHWLTFRFMYIIDVSTVQLYCNTISFRFSKVFAKSL